MLCVSRRLTEIEIYPAADASSGEMQQPKFSLKIRTDQRHASELLGILADHIRPTETARESHLTHETSAGLPVSKADPNPPMQSMESKPKDENIGVTVITSQTTIPGVFIPSDYNSSSDSHDGQNENDDGDESDSD